MEIFLTIQDLESWCSTSSCCLVVVFSSHRKHVIFHAHMTAFISAWHQTAKQSGKAHIPLLSHVSAAISIWSVSASATTALKLVGAGGGFMQPGLVESFPAHGRSVGTTWCLRSLPSLTILWFCEMITNTYLIPNLKETLKNLHAVSSNRTDGCN